MILEMLRDYFPEKSPNFIGGSIVNPLINSRYRPNLAREQFMEKIMKYTMIVPQTTFRQPMKTQRYYLLMDIQNLQMISVAKR